MSQLIDISQKDRGFNIRSITIADLVNSFKKAIIVKQEEMQEFGITIKNIKLTLKTIATADAGAKLSLNIPILGKIEFGSKLSEKSIQTTNITLKPLKEGNLNKEIELLKIDETVANSISSIIEGVKAANTQDSIPLEMDEATFEFNFILSGDSEISMIIESGFESELSNTLKINFEKQENS